MYPVLKKNVTKSDREKMGKSENNPNLTPSLRDLFAPQSAAAKCQPPAHAASPLSDSENSLSQPTVMKLAGITRDEIEAASASAFSAKVAGRGDDLMTGDRKKEEKGEQKDKQKLITTGETDSLAAAKHEDLGRDEDDKAERGENWSWKAASASAAAGGNNDKHEAEDGEEEEEEIEPDERTPLASEHGAASKTGESARQLNESEESEGSNDGDSTRSKSNARMARLKKRMARYKDRLKTKVEDMLSWSRLLIAVSIVAIAMLSILVAGCSSYHMRGIWLVSFSYADEVNQQDNIVSTDAVLNPAFYELAANISSMGDLQVRVGYFGLCAASRGYSNSNWICRSSATEIAETLNSTLDPLNLLAVADNYKDGVVVSVFIIASTVLLVITTFINSTFPGWHDEETATGEVEVRPFPRVASVGMIIACNSIAIAILLVAVIWQHVAAVAHSAGVQSIFGEVVKTRIGTTAMGLGWGAVMATAVSVLMPILTFMYLSYHIKLLKSG